ncbi:MAG TPA: type II toxin-antitoxin system VapC family toxin [Sporichthyaceae bacterium]|nr:type II toxin-antitoxin system VapC family toxin [Sporichthyaceae bacterium]
MSPVVVDNSVVLYVLLEGSRDDVLRRRLSEPRTLHAPHLIDYEFGNALRGLRLGGRISDRLTQQVRADFADLRIERHPGATTADRAWQLRKNYTCYDAAYIALAEMLDCPLLTGDAKLHGPHRAQVEVVGQ